jgi:hypothetical protein
MGGRDGRLGQSQQTNQLAHSIVTRSKSQVSTAVINVTARMLGITVPPTLLSNADRVIPYRDIDRPLGFVHLILRFIGTKRTS